MMMAFDLWMAACAVGFIIVVVGMFFTSNE
jgi:hypothetical protein